jgi:hypothetical protein
MTKQQTKFKKAVAIAKQLRKSNPAIKYTDAIKKAFKSLGSTTHKDTKSHNVNIRVVSGVKKKIGAITSKTAKKLASHWHGGQRSALYSYASTGKYFPNMHNDYLKEINSDLKGNYTKTELSELNKLKNFFELQNKKVGATLLLEKGETPRTKAGTFKKWKTLGEAPSFSDSDMAREISLYADNNSQLYYSRRMPILKNLYKKWKKGNFKVDLAAKLWKYYVEDAMHRYNKDHGSRGDKWHKLLSVADRKLLSHQYAKDTLHDFENHVYSDADMK